MKRAIVTGASGFVGKALTQHLLSLGYQVIAIVRDSKKLSDIDRENLCYVEADFSTYNKLHEKIPSGDIFYHLAWEGAYGAKTSDYNIQLQNIQATCEALEQANMMGCKKFVFAGTVAELEVMEHIDKNVCFPRNTCIYATAKLCAEMMCKTIAARYGIEFNAGLLANIVGPGDFSKRSTNTILNKLLHGVAPKLVKGEGLNDWLYIKDAVMLIAAMGEYGRNMKTYYIGHSELWTFRTIIERARDVVAPDLTLVFGEVEDTFLTNYDYTSTGALRADTGVEPQYSFEDMVRETAAWVKTLNMES